MPQIHLHAEPGDYAPVVLLPGRPDPGDAIAARFDGGLEATPPGQRATAASRLHGHGRRRPGVRPDDDDGLADDRIVVEELLMLGVTTFIRVGTTGGFGRAPRSAT